MITLTLSITKFNTATHYVTGILMYTLYVYILTCSLFLLTIHKIYHIEHVLSLYCCLILLLYNVLQYTVYYRPLSCIVSDWVEISILL